MSLPDSPHGAPPSGVESVDLLCVGSGAASLSAALRAHDLGARVLIVEAADKYGGSTAISGGVVWIPNNPQMAGRGIPDSPADAVPGVMARALLGAIGVAAPCRVELPIGRVLFHGLGTAGGAVLAGCWPKGSLRSAGPLAMVFAEWPALWPDPTAATASLGRLHRSIGRSLGMGAFHAVLPEEEQLAAVRGLCEMDRVEALVRAGMPALAPADQPELWGEAADW